MGKKCVECGDHVPAYQNHLCEECWKEALKDSIHNKEPEIQK